MRKLFFSLSIGALLTVSLTACGNSIDTSNLDTHNPQPTIPAKVEKSLTDGAKTAGSATGSLIKTGTKQVKKLERYEHSKAGKDATQKLGKSVGKAAKDVGSAVGDYLNKLP